MRKSHALASLSFLSVAMTGAASVLGASVFSDDFNRNTINEFGTVWVGQSGTTADMNGEIVADPLGGALPGAGVLAFDATKAGGDTFTSVAFAVTPGQQYTLSFDYLGTPAAGPPNGNGGFIGLSDGLPGNHYWLAGTAPVYVTNQGLNIIASPAATTLLDNAGWNNYVIQFTPGAGVTSLRVMIEDFAGVSGDGQFPGTPGDAFFDNISVTTVPTPAAAMGGVMLLGGLAAKRRRTSVE